MKKLLLLFILLLLPFTGIAEERTYRVYVVQNFAPYFFVDDDGVMKGLGIDVIHEIVKQQNLKVSYHVVQTWKEMWSAVDQGKVDIIPNVGFTPERARLLHFSKPYVSFEVGIRYAGEPAENIRDFCGKVIGVIASQAARKKLEETGCISIKDYPSYDGVNVALLKKNIKGALVPDPTWKSFAKLTDSESKFPHFFKLQQIERGIGVNKKYPELVQKMDQSLKSMEHYGKLRKMKYEWLSDYQEAGDLAFTFAEKSWIDAQKEPLVLGIDPNWLPIEGYDVNRNIHLGMAADYIQLISKFSGLKFQILKTDNWGATISEVKAGNVDIVPAVMKTPGLSNYLNFTSAYMSFPVSVFLKDNAAFIESMESLKGKKIAMVKASEAYEKVRSEWPQLRFFEVGSIEEGLDMLTAGEVDAFIENQITAAHQIRKSGMTGIKVSLKTGYTFDLAVGVKSNLPPAAFSVISKSMVSISEKEKLRIFNQWHSTKEGNRFDFVLLIRIIVAALILFVVVLIWNFTLRAQVGKRVQAENQLQKANQLLQEQNAQIESSIMGADLGTWDWNLLDGSLKINDRWAEMIGYKKEELTLTPFDMESFLHPEDLQEVNQKLDMHTRGEVPFYQAEFRLKTKTDDWHWVNSGGKIVERDGSGKAVRMAGVHLDIHQQKMTHEALQVQQEYLNSILLSSLNGVYVYDLKHDKFGFVSQQYTNITGLTQDELQTMTNDEYMERIHPDDQKAVREHNQNISKLEKGDLLSIKFRFWFNQSWKWLKSVDTPYEIDEEYRVQKIVGTCIDITDDEEVSRTLSDLSYRLKQSNENLENFAYIASHDLQEPLRVISGHLQLLERKYRDSLDEKGIKFLNFAVDGAVRMQRLIEGLLKFSRVHTTTVDRKKVQLNALVEQILQSLHHKIEETKAEIRVEELPEVNADPEQVKIVLQNLLSNALKFSDTNPEIHVFTGKQDGVSWIYVKDNGIGFDTQFKKKAFSLFKRLHSRAEYSGEGIGLAISKKIVENHGGRIEVVSEPGKGSTFSFYLSDPMKSEEVYEA